MSEVQLRIRIDDESDLEAVSEAAEAPDVDYEEITEETGDDTTGLVAPIIAVVIGAGVVWLAEFIWSKWQDRRGGVVIDQRPDRTDDIYRDPDLPAGWCVIYPADGGAVTVEVKDAPKTMTERLISDVISGVVKSTTDIANKAAELLGKDKVQTKEPAASTE